MVLLLSYNVLAPPYCTQTQYPFAPDSIFRHDLRLKKITKSIESLNPDIFCLQEVTEHWSTIFITKFSSEWTIVFSPYGGPATDRVGVLLAYRKSYRCSSIKILCPGLTSSDPRAKRFRNSVIVATFDGFSVATFHAPCAPHIPGFLLNYIREVEKLITETTDGNVLFAGDFNSLPSDPIYGVLLKSGWKSCIKTIFGKEKITNFAHTRFSEFKGTLDYIFYKGGIECISGNIIGTTYQPMPNILSPSDHTPIWGDFKIE